MTTSKRHEGAHAETAACELKSNEIKEMLSIYGIVADGLGHKVSDLLMPIRAFSKMAIEQMADGDDIAGAILVSNIHKHTQELSEVIESLRALNYSEYKILEVCNPADVFNMTLENMMLSERDGLFDGIEVYREGLLADGRGKTSDLVRVDSDDIRTILIELCANAAQAMRGDGGTLTLRLEKETLGRGDARELDLSPGDYMVLKVVDEGEGMTHPVLQKVFLPFYTTRAGGEANGLGLWKVYGAVINLDGAISVKTRQDRGSEFSVYLPVSRS